MTNAYGCTKCQEWHYEKDAEFKAHIGYQSKHGIMWRPDRPADVALSEIDRMYQGGAGNDRL